MIDNNYVQLIKWYYDPVEDLYVEIFKSNHDRLMFYDWDHYVTNFSVPYLTALAYAKIPNSI